MKETGYNLDKLGATAEQIEISNRKLMDSIIELNNKNKDVNDTGRSLMEVYYEINKALGEMQRILGDKKNVRTKQPNGYINKQTNLSNDLLRKLYLGDNELGIVGMKANQIAKQFGYTQCGILRRLERLGLRNVNKGQVSCTIDQIDKEEETTVMIKETIVVIDPITKIESKKEMVKCETEEDIMEFFGDDFFNDTTDEDDNIDEGDN